MPFIGENVERRTGLDFAAEKAFGVHTLILGTPLITVVGVQFAFIIICK